MKFVPIPPPMPTVARDELQVEALAAVKAAKPVQPRSLPPLVVQYRTRSKGLPDSAGQQDRSQDVRLRGERRTYCRRIEHLPEFIELRVGLDRRQHNRRGDDMTEHVDEKA